MNQEKLKVLEMLEKGTITAEEALRLIELLQKGEDPLKEDEPAVKVTEDECDVIDGNHTNQDKEAHKEHKNHEPNLDFSWINDLKNNVIDSAINISRYVGSQTYNAFGFGRPDQFYSTSCDNIENLKSLKLIGKNDRVEVVGHQEDNIKIEARYKLKGDSDLRIEFEEEDGAYKLSYDYNAVHSMGLCIKVPERQIPYLSVDNKNAEIMLKRVNAEKADLTTKNATIELDTVTGGDLTAETKNARIYVYDISVSKISLKTDNSVISVKSANADFAKLLTSNAPINLDGINIREIYAKTSNAGMFFRNFYNDERKTYSLYNLEAYTSNGDLTVELPLSFEIPCKLNASTSLGHIHTDVENLDYLVDSKDFIKAKSKDYDIAESKINITLQTSNSNINIRSLG